MMIPPPCSTVGKVFLGLQPHHNFSSHISWQISVQLEGFAFRAGTSWSTPYQTITISTCFTVEHDTCVTTVSSPGLTFLVAPEHPDQFPLLRSDSSLLFLIFISINAMQPVQFHFNVSGLIFPNYFCICEVYFLYGLLLVPLCFTVFFLSLKKSQYIQPIIYIVHVL